jgi:hypothetical protein
VISCGAVERHLVDVVRRAASRTPFAWRSRHTSALYGGCRETRAAFGLLGALRGQPTPRLGAAAEARIVEQLALVGGVAPSGPSLGSRRSWPVVSTASTALALVALAFAAVVSGQLLFENGAGAEGAAAMNDYLSRYPRGPVRARGARTARGPTPTE